MSIHSLISRWLPEFATVSVLDAPWKQASIAYIKGLSIVSFDIHLLMSTSSGAATTASRLGQPDVAIATLNDFVEVSNPIFRTEAWCNERLQAAQMVCSLDPTMPLIADADTGYIDYTMPGRWISF